MSADDAKRAAAAEAVKLVEPDMTLGLGTGSTAAHFVDLLGERVRDGLQLRALPTSKETERQALACGIDIIVPDETTTIDLAVDGTDEIDTNLALIKGGGGALLREKIIAQAAKKFVVIADASKKVSTLGKFSLPIEIDPFSWALTVQEISTLLQDMGYQNSPMQLRPSPQGTFQSDGGHFILDCALQRIEDPRMLDQTLRALPGVVETGLFVGMVTTAYLVAEDGTIETLQGE